MGSNQSNLNSKVKPLRTRVQMDWGQVSRETLASFISLVTSEGCAVVLGRTINGSALSLCILAGSTKARDYIGNLDDVEPVMDSLLQECQIGPYNPFAK